MVQLMINFDQSLTVYTTYRASNSFSIFAFGSRIKLNENFQINYSSQTEAYDYDDQNIQSISIGVMF